jgi:hypothetical protein
MHHLTTYTRDGGLSPLAEPSWPDLADRGSCSRVVYT